MLAAIDKYRYPIVLTLALALAATLLFGPLIGLRGEELRYVASGEGTLGILVAWLLRGPGNSSAASGTLSPSRVEDPADDEPSEEEP